MELNYMLKISYFHTLITLCSKTMLDINRTLLQFIDVINLLDLLLNLFPSVSSVTQVISAAKVSVWVFV